MNELMTKTSNQEVTITLKEITDLISVEHSKAMKKVESLSKEPSFGHLAKIATCINIGNGATREIETYLLNKKQAIAVGAKLNNSLLMKVIDKVESLGQSKSLYLPQNYVEALEALTIAEKEKLALASKIHEKDKVILAVADLNIKAGNVTIGDFSKNLAIENLGRNNLFSWLKARNYIMMNTEPYQQYMQRGYFVRKPTDKRIGGEVRYTTLLTPKGTVWLTKLLKAEFELDEAVA